MKITNRDIYDEIRALKDQNEIQHREIIQHQLSTNGKVKLNKWIATTALSLIVALLVGVAGSIILWR